MSKQSYPKQWCEEHPVQRHEVICVVWMDSCSAEGWKYESQYDKTPSTIVSVGFLAYEDDRTISITTSISESGGVMDPLTIPRGCIVSITTLAEQLDVDADLLKAKGVK